MTVCAPKGFHSVSVLVEEAGSPRAIISRFRGDSERRFGKKQASRSARVEASAVLQRWSIQSAGCTGDSMRIDLAHHMHASGGRAPLARCRRILRGKGARCFVLQGMCHMYCIQHLLLHASSAAGQQGQKHLQASFAFSTNGVGGEEQRES